MWQLFRSHLDADEHANDAISFAQGPASVGVILTRENSIPGEDSRPAKADDPKVSFLYNCTMFAILHMNKTEGRIMFY